MRIWFIGILFICSGGVVRAEKFIIDPTHSTVSFKIKGPIGKVKGRFEKFEGHFEYVSDQHQQWSSIATIATDSILTGIKRRDSDLKGPGFLDVNTYPTMVFTSTGVNQFSDGKTHIMGDLIIRGVTHPVVLIVDSVEVVPNDSGEKSAHVKASTRIERKSFNVGLTHGTFMAGKFVDIYLDIQGMAKPVQ